MIAPAAEPPTSTLVLARTMAGFAALAAVTFVAALLLREPLTRFGHAFVARFGLVGMLTGAFLADGLHFPVPPQFYLLTGIAAGHAPPGVLGSVLVGSELGGLVAFTVGRRAGRWPWLARRLAGSSTLLRDLFARRGYSGLALAALLPVSYSLLCAAGGALRLPWRAWGVLAVLRVPRLLVSFALIAVAWQR